MARARFGEELKPSLQSRSGVAAGVALLVLAAPLSAAAHEPGASTHTGFIATVASIEPNVLGLRGPRSPGRSILLSNLSPTRVVILDPSGGIIRVPSSGTPGMTGAYWRRVNRRPETSRRL